MFTENSVGKGTIGYRGGSMGHKGSRTVDDTYKYEKYDREYPEYDRMEHRGDYGRRFM